ncbi:nitrogen fixation protein NifZ [Cereibacter ovatus]|uniref:Nitrogen fixation protein NifZ n=1 Tax=Cereibacter ovatus TaxID=439529 RepID=A0A285CQ60_9RHOB|nr:nitrogen fixation protein NifZ [Cereibacter ovatus]SNX69206.1 nitrogen fixation protein NifZ [Cereibacter ovatus]
MPEVDDTVEIYDDPLFQPGEKVRSRFTVKNDGTMWDAEIGEIVVHKGDEGYVRDVGTYLQRYYIYAVEFVDRRRIVGMRGRELIGLDNPEGTK